MAYLYMIQWVQAVVLKNDNILWFDSGNKNMIGNIFWTRPRTRSSCLERPASPKWAMVIFIKSDQDHNNETGHPEQSVENKQQNPPRTILNHS